MITKETLIDLANRQKKLDDYIYEKRQIKFNEEISNKKLIAFFVELGEFINEERSFKFWSQKTASPRNILLEEYIDGMHFILSIGIEINFDFCGFSLNLPVKLENLELDYLELIKNFSNYAQKKSLKNYEKLITSFLLIGTWFSFTEKELLETYFKKNEINFNRQNDNY
ncbi:dUTP diphosphatase [Spiroplasma alleghenense]|uniref:dUTP diphosphatase n=1 Tax=Spiroplasma alleghenense TaxID=216931 RepID=A0A345Z3Y4_9MOLU|nr:dUTP diphosphatase [Spiroplasma alleghenense]AXK51313.1 dUTP diphosphatase [Spiroplasma alleghenense]